MIADLFSSYKEAIFIFAAPLLGVKKHGWLFIEISVTFVPDLWSSKCLSFFFLVCLHQLLSLIYLIVSTANIVHVSNIAKVVSSVTVHYLEAFLLMIYLDITSALKKTS